MNKEEQIADTIEMLYQRLNSYNKQNLFNYGYLLESNQILCKDIEEKEIERLNNVINELEKCIKEKYYQAIDYQTKIRQSDLMQGDYPVSYYYSEQQELICNYFLNRIKDLKEGK